MRGIDAVDVEGRIGFGVAELLRFGEHLVEAAPGLAHGGQDVVAGAVQDAVDAGDAVAGKALAHRFDDRNAAGNGRLIADGGAVGLGERGKLRAVMGEQRLVGGDHRLAGAKCLAGEIEGDALRAADQLDHRIDLGIGGERHRILVPAEALQIDTAVARAIARRDRLDGDLASGARAEQAPFCLSSRDHAGADGAEAGNAEFERRAMMLCHRFLG